MEIKGPRIAKTILTTELELMLPGFKAKYKAVVMKTVCYCR